MKVPLLTFLLFSVAYATYRQDFCDITSKYIVFWKKDSIGNIADAILTDIANLKTMSEIGSNCIGYVTSNTPLWDGFSLIGMQNKMDTDLKPCPSKSMDYLVGLMPALSKILKKPYQLMKAKAETMAANKKSAAYKLDQLYKIAKATCTVDLIQHLVWSASKNSTSCEWVAAVKGLPTIFNLTGLDLTWAGTLPWSKWIVNVPG